MKKEEFKKVDGLSRFIKDGCYSVKGYKKTYNGEVFFMEFCFPPRTNCLKALLFIVKESFKALFF